MLKRLSIQNIALIKKLELEFYSGLNILSGETGAGKSIIVDSLMLLLGGRYDKSIIRYGQNEGYVEGVFEADEKNAAKLSDLGFDEDDLIIINRKFTADGRGDIRINGKSASISMLRQLTNGLVDIYGQNEYQTFSKPCEHLRILNHFVRQKTASVLKTLGENFLSFQKVNRELKELGSVSERERNIDILKFQAEEIEKARAYDGEEDEIVEKRRLILSAERIASALKTAMAALSGGESGNALEYTGEAQEALNGISDFSSSFSELAERLNSLSIELDDIAQSISDEFNGADYDESDLEKLEARLELLRSLKRKYGNFAQMKKFLTESKETLYKLENSSDLYEKLTGQKETLIKNLYEDSLKLSQIRKEGAKEFENLLRVQAKDLGMPDAVFKIEFEPLPTLSDCESYLTAQGLDKAEFHFSANAGQPLKPLIKIISGGEMSRFILALKVISSQVDDIPTMIFDEIDTGISGIIGQEVAKKLALISRSRQVLCVTHLAQIASMADNHYFISKATTEGQTETNVGLLSESGAVDEISRLSGAKGISAQSGENAAQMKKWSEEFKKTL